MLVVFTASAVVITSQSCVERRARHVNHALTNFALVLLTLQEKLERTALYNLHLELGGKASTAHIVDV